MSKNINIASHVKRYEQTEVRDILNLIDGLKELVELRKKQTLVALKEQVAMLELGEIPEEAPKPEKRTRGGKKKTEEVEEA